MNNAAKKALEKEWKAQQTQLLNERIATEEAVKSELLGALKERLKELKREEAESRKGLPLAERIAKISGYKMADNWYEQKNTKDAIKDLTNPKKEKTYVPVKDMTLTEQQKHNREMDTISIARGYGVDGTEVDSWVEAQAKARLTDKGLTKPAPAEPLPPEVIQEIVDARAARVKQHVADLTNSNVNYYEMAKYVAIKEQSDRVVEQQMAEIQHGFRGRENIQEPKEQTVAPVVELSESQTRAAVAIDARAEVYKETVAEVGIENANAQVTPEVAKDWVAADANDFKQLANEELAIEAAEVISTTAEQVEAYGAALDNQPELAAAVATARELDNDPVYVADPETQFESISPADAAKEDRKAADMDTITPADLAAYDVLEAQQADNAVYMNSQADEALAADIQQASAELGKEPEQQRESIPEGWNKDPIPENWNQEPAAEIIPEDWNKEAEADPFGAPLEGGMTVDELEATDAAIEAEQQREAIPENWNQEPAAEIIPEDWNKEAEADPFGAPLEGGMTVDELEATDAAIEAEQQREAIPENWNQEPAAEIIPEDWNKEPAAEIIPEDWNKDADHDALNTIEPVTERTVEAPKAEQVVIDQQTLDNLAKARAADRQAVEEQLGQDSEKAGFVDKPLKGNQVESDEILTARKETVKPVLPPEVEREYVNVGNKYYSQKNPETVAFEDKGNKLETRSNNEQVASNLVKIAEARGWDEIKVSGSETFRREVWAEAAARGMHVKGYTPNDQDKANLAKRMVDMEANKVEATKGRDKQPDQNAKSPDEKKRDEIQAARAASFKNDSPETALKKHPELAGAYAAQAAMQKKMEADKLPPQQQAVVQERIRDNLVNSIERGQLPDVKRREEVTNKREVSEEREMGR